MKASIRRIATAALIALTLGVAAGRADAAPFNLTHDPNPNVLVGVGSPYEFSFNIPGFDVATDTIDSASLSIELSDPDGGAEIVRFSFDGQIWDENNTPDDPTEYSSFGTIDIASSLADGELNVIASVVQKGKNNPPTYYFNSANLQGSYTRTLHETVPEPASLVLLGAGLLGAGFARRRTIG